MDFSDCDCDRESSRVCNPFNSRSYPKVQYLAVSDNRRSLKSVCVTSANSHNVAFSQPRFCDSNDAELRARTCFYSSMDTVSILQRRSMATA